MRESDNSFHFSVSHRFRFLFFESNKPLPRVLLFLLKLSVIVLTNNFQFKKISQLGFHYFKERYSSFFFFFKLRNTDFSPQFMELSFWPYYISVQFVKSLVSAWLVSDSKSAYPLFGCWRNQVFGFYTLWFLFLENGNIKRLLG